MNVNKRRRRTPEEARILILDTAEQRLAELGLEGLNIVGVARAAGMSHATLIHHFGSTEGMRKALVERMTDRLIGEAVAAAGNNAEVRQVFRDLFEVFSAGGHAKLLAWLAIEASNQPDPDPERQSRFAQLVDACAAQLPGESLEAVRNLVTTAVCAAIGLGVAGEPLMALVNMNAEQRAAFPDWIADRLGLGAEPGDGARAG